MEFNPKDLAQEGSGKQRGIPACFTFIIPSLDKVIADMGKQILFLGYEFLIN